MEGKKTHWKKLDNPNYLGAYSLMDGLKKDLTVTIERVVIEEVKTDRGSEQCKVAYLKGQKPIILNATNCKVITKILGTPYIEDWSGEKITLFVANIKAFGENIEALRVRPEKPTTQLPELNPSHHKWEGAKKAILAKNTTIESIKKAYALTPENEKLLCDSK